MAPSENFRDVTVHVPAGLVGYPTATSQKCTVAQLSQQAVSPRRQIPLCPRDSQIGSGAIIGKDSVPVYNLVAPPVRAGRVRVLLPRADLCLRPKLRPSDNGIDIVTERAPSAVPIAGFEVTLWGIA